MPMTALPPSTLTTSALPPSTLTTTTLTTSGLTTTALPTAARAGDDRVVDLAVRRAAAEAAVRAVADAPVRHLPAALLDALRGSWGTAEELLAGRTAPVRLAVVR